MKSYISLMLFFSLVYVNAQTIDAGLLQRISQNDESATTNSGTFLSRADITGTPEEGAIFYDNITKNVYVYTDNGWRRVYIAPKVTEVTGNYTLTDEDDGNVLKVNSNSSVALTVPAGLPIGFNVSVYQTGTGNIIITPSGTTLHNRLSCFVTAGQHSGAGILSTDTNVFHITGDLTR